jgi:hypothetical protein
VSDAHDLPVSRFMASVGWLQESVVIVGGEVSASHAPHRRLPALRWARSAKHRADGRLHLQHRHGFVGSRWEWLGRYSWKLITDAGAGWSAAPFSSAGPGANVPGQPGKGGGHA